MALSSNSFSLFLLLAILQGRLLGASYGHRNHVVGGRFGWNFPPNTTFYREWAAKNTFIVGDKLVFLYSTGVENVFEVSAEDFKRCGDSNVIEMYEMSPTIVELKSPGHHFFYSGVGLHCDYGQKLAVNVKMPLPPFDADEYINPILCTDTAPAPTA